MSSSDVSDTEYDSVHVAHSQKSCRRGYIQILTQECVGK